MKTYLESVIDTISSEFQIVYIDVDTYTNKYEIGKSFIDTERYGIIAYQYMPTTIFFKEGSVLKVFGFNKEELDNCLHL